MPCVNSTSALAPNACAMPAQMASMRFLKRVRVASTVVRMVPTRHTFSGRTLAASPPLKLPMVSTPCSSGASSRAVRFCRAE